jgi:hypothetical protein
MNANWTYYLLIALVIEKVIQHGFVTLAFYFNWKDIASTVVVSPESLMILGALIGILFVVSLWGMVRKQASAITLAAALAVFDIVGEFVAQGRLDIMITVSFLVAVVLLILAWRYYRKFVVLTADRESGSGVSG